MLLLCKNYIELLQNTTIKGTIPLNNTNNETYSDKARTSTNNNVCQLLSQYVSIHLCILLHKICPYTTNIIVFLLHNQSFVAFMTPSSFYLQQESEENWNMTLPALDITENMKSHSLLMVDWTKEITIIRTDCFIQPL